MTTLHAHFDPKVIAEAATSGMATALAQLDTQRGRIASSAVSAPTKKLPSDLVTELAKVTREFEAEIFKLQSKGA